MGFGKAPGEALSLAGRLEELLRGPEPETEAPALGDRRPETLAPALGDLLTEADTAEAGEHQAVVRLVAGIIASGASATGANQTSAFRLLWRGLAGDFHDRAPSLTADVMVTLSDDSDWIVRETAAALAGDLLARRFDSFYPTALAWTGSESENVRRMAALAVMYASRKRKEAWASRILDVLERLLPDPAVYVRKNLGPFAIGSALLMRHPAQTLERLRRWALSPDERVLWNVAMAFSAAPAKAHLETALDLLGPLSGHPSRLVWRAAASSLRFLGRHNPARVIPLLEEWREDPARTQAAETALGYLKKG
jgi:hypothetical protein